MGGEGGAPLPSSKALPLPPPLPPFLIHPFPSPFGGGAASSCGGAHCGGVCVIRGGGGNALTPAPAPHGLRGAHSARQSDRRSAAAKERCAEALQRFRDGTHPEELQVYTRQGYVAALGLGIGVHHSGCGPAWRVLMEDLFRNGALALVVATSTLAVGLHMPCRTVVFAADSPAYLTPSGLRQMAGRAGRRGHDPFGRVVFAVARDGRAGRAFAAGRVRALCGSPPEPLCRPASLTAALGLRLLRLARVAPAAAARALAHPLAARARAYAAPARLCALYLRFLHAFGYVTARGEDTWEADAVLSAGAEGAGAAPFLLQQLLALQGPASATSTSFLALSDPVQVLATLAYLHEPRESSRDAEAAPEAATTETTTGTGTRASAAPNTRRVLPPLPGPVRAAIRSYNARVLRIVHAFCADIAPPRDPPDSAGGAEAFAGLLVGVPGFVEAPQSPGPGPGPAAGPARPRGGAFRSFAKWAEWVEQTVGVPLGQLPVFDSLKPRPYNGYVLMFVTTDHGLDVLLRSSYCDGLFMNDLVQGLVQFYRFVHRVTRNFVHQVRSPGPHPPWPWPWPCSCPSPWLCLGPCGCGALRVRASARASARPRARAGPPDRPCARVPRG